MFVKVNSVSFYGLTTYDVCVEVNISTRGLPGFEIVGLPAKSIAESKYRIKAAFTNSKIEFPDKRIVVNLAPADMHKEGSFYDLPIALGIMSNVFNFPIPTDSLFFGELGLDGEVRYTRGALLLALYAKENRYKNIFVPIACVAETQLVKDINVYGVKNLKELFDFFVKHFPISTAKRLESIKEEASFDDNVPDFKDISGQATVKRALEICAAGGHNIIMMGNPGVGKTMLARALIGILPSLSEQELIEVAKIYTYVGKFCGNNNKITMRPFRSPHHTISYTGMVGGGNIPIPGEITLAHRGILFMDEFGEFSREVLETLRKPLEDGFMTISRSRGTITFPSRFVLVASSNPCPCGYFGHPAIKCKCSHKKIEAYQKKLSGPILDRIDIHANVSPVKISDLSIANVESNNENSREIRKRVEQARQIQLTRFRGESIFCNAEMTNTQVKKYCVLDKESTKLLNLSTEKFSLSARAYFKLLKTARTIADLDSSENVGFNHVAEAVQYRCKTSL